FSRNLPGCVKHALVGAGVGYDDLKTPEENFGNAIDALAAKGKPPVILIDEYDDPVACALKNPDDAERVRDALAPVYKQMKDRSGKIRFLMITGVSKFTKLSVFSALSSLVDISFDDDYAAMLGYTEEELERYFSEHMDAHRKVLGMSAKAYLDEIKRLYNGYRFWKFRGENVYNPVSINLTMANRKPEFELYWAKTGKASFLMNMLKRDEVLAVDLNNLKSVSEAAFDVSDLRNFPVEGMLYQTGYLTIKDYKHGLFDLGVPTRRCGRICRRS
ncbi:MAG: AAA family ATPase, partial [Kiritimatiellae bacterium]|nr:AAA family ATPase [Kiritimatiellia bacterium]